MRGQGSVGEGGGQWVARPNWRAATASAAVVSAGLYALPLIAQPIIPEAAAGSLGVCDSSNPYPRAKIAIEADVGDCNTDTSGAGTDQVLCICMPDGLGGYSWEAVSGGTDDQIASEVPVTDAGGYYAGADVESVLSEIGPTTTDSRVPTAHAATHGDGGTDEIAAEDLATACVDGKIIKALSGGWECADDEAGGAAATEIDADADGTAEVRIEFGGVVYDLDDDGADDLRLNLTGGGDPIWRTGAGGAALGISTQVDAYMSIAGTSAGGPEIENSVSSLTNPTLIGNKADPDSGVGCDGSGSCAGIADSTTAIRWDSSLVTLDVRGKVEPEASCSGSCAQGTICMDTSGALCICTATDTWTNATGIGSCS